MRPAIREVRSSDLAPAEWQELTDLCEAAYAEPWGDYWSVIGPGLHMLAESPDGGILAHAAIVERLLYPGDRSILAAYVEAVAVLPQRQGQGLGTLVMERIDRIIDDGYQLGGLATGSQSWYARLGWEVWQGPTSVRQPDGRLQRSPDEDGGIMVRRTATTPSWLDLSEPIAVDWRPDEPW